MACLASEPASKFTRPRTAGIEAVIRAAMVGVGALAVCAVCFVSFAAVMAVGDGLIAVVSVGLVGQAVRLVACLP